MPDLVFFADDARRRLGRIGNMAAVWSSWLLRASDRLILTTNRREAEIEAYGIVPVVAVVDELATYVLDLAEHFQADPNDLRDQQARLLDEHPDYRHVRDVLVHAVAYQGGVGDRQHPGTRRWKPRPPQPVPMDLWVTGEGDTTRIGMAGTDAHRGMVWVHVFPLAILAADLAGRTQLAAATVAASEPNAPTSDSPFPA